MISIISICRSAAGNNTIRSVQYVVVIIIMFAGLPRRKLNRQTFDVAVVEVRTDNNNGITLCVCRDQTEFIDSHVARHPVETFAVYCTQFLYHYK